ncbi:hypothetical protein Mp_6g21240 [Marchantia polymorpha subsp. ruderalis]|uniref:KIB1-4 beta-propeller domain-containing protein n=2 Tax=Marchantia polymorpha TaxID=3197 RepID=A0AAF6BUG1_MARPO|nr:hypothetical protein MARPO_0091s0031 [Marchantia polymorpha]BBN15645.1 hypothetical protein Mp_6g21240 [Marchantia polymorpha subsp. ruderalis]|eukprot:PTQ33169.1 hypothetical protein MARPO_0091s0031 [Marchantia polymorpha]
MVTPSDHPGDDPGDDPCTELVLCNLKGDFGAVALACKMEIDSSDALDPLTQLRLCTMMDEGATMESKCKQTRSEAELRSTLWSALPRETLGEFRFMTAGGLVFVVSRSTRPDSRLDIAESVEDLIMTVYNPVTRKWRQIEVPFCTAQDPQVSAQNPKKVRVNAVGMVVDRLRSKYSVIAACYFTNDVQILVYDSVSRSWEDGGKIPSHFSRGCLDFIYSAISSEGRLFFLKRRLVSAHAREYKAQKRNPRMLEYNVAEKSWREVTFLPKHTGAGRPYLVENRGDVLYVARASWTKKRVRYNTWFFYKLKSRVADGPAALALTWEKVGEMPIELHETLNKRINQGGFYTYAIEMSIAGSGDRIYFSGPAPVAEQTTVGAMIWRVLVHDLKANTWDWLPDYVLEDGRPSLNVGESLLVTLEPSFMKV